MFEFIFTLLAGSLIGIIAGVLPGVGMLSTISICYPFLLKLEPLNIIFFYVSVLSMAQYVGSIVALHLGIPGDGSSYPAVIEGMKMKSLKYTATVFTSIGSLIGGIYSLIFFFLIFYLFKIDLNFIFKTSVTVSVFIFAVFSLTCFCKNTIFLNLLFLLIGYGLGFIGWNPELNLEILIFGMSELSLGIPFMPIVMGFLVIPEMIFNMTIPRFKKLKRIKIRISRYFKYYLMPTLRGIFVGFFVGFTPGLTVDLSANLAYFLEQKMRWRQMNRPNFSALIAAESANNAGVFSCVLPVIIFGLPISGSEVLLLNILYSKGIFFDTETVLSIITVIPFVIITINILGFLCSWPFASTVLSIFKLPKYLIFFILALFILVSVVALSTNQIMFDLTLLFLFTLIGIILKNKQMDLMPLIIGFLLQNSFNSAIFRFFKLYF